MNVWVLVVLFYFMESVQLFYFLPLLAFYLHKVLAQRKLDWRFWEFKKGIKCIILEYISNLSNQYKSNISVKHYVGMKTVSHLIFKCWHYLFYLSNIYWCVDNTQCWVTCLFFYWFHLVFDSLWNLNLLELESGSDLDLWFEHLSFVLFLRSCCELELD